MNITATTEGDLGDAVMVAAILAIRGGSNRMLLSDSTVTKWRTLEIVEKAHSLLAPLLHGVDGIAKFGIYRRDCTPDWLSQDFRWRHYRPDQTLFESHVQHLRSSVPNETHITWRPWLSVKPDSRFWNKWVVNRSARHRNELFPWHRLVQSYGHKMVFIGTPDEHQDFCSSFGHVAYHETPTLLDVARAIAGSQRFIGNQSSAHCIAASLGHPLLLEVSKQNPDVCFGGKNALYCYDGGIPYYSMPRTILPQHCISKSMVPPGFWQYPGFKPQQAFNQMTILMSQAGVVDAANELLRHNTLRLQIEHPSYIGSTGFSIVQSALSKIV